MPDFDKLGQTAFALCMLQTVIICPNSLISDCYPQVVRCKDKRLELPLHSAYLTQAASSLEVIEHLI